MITNRERTVAKKGTYVGAEILSNNTAEMQAVIETLLFLQAQIETDGSIFEVGDAVVIHSDS